PALAAAAASAPSQAGAASSGERDDSSVGGDLASGAEPKASEVAKAAKAAELAELDDGGDPWQTRQLCDDGSCIGVVVDGRCTTCGKTPS
ncbi:MAG TPA: hypothetical protein PKU97_16215, partial [Kofleriaceae bacterium]|nr:hypothetical protein [Kofleriaceae bacterium]